MSTITIPNIDPTTFCRVCFADINLLIVVLPGSVDEGTNQHLLQLVKTYLRLDFGGSKDFSCAVCELCYRLLQEFDLLYKNAQRNNEALQVFLDSEPYYESVLENSPEKVLDVQDTTSVEIFEPSPATEDGSNAGKHNQSDDLVAGDELLDSQIILEEVPFTGTSNEEHQVHVFHLDGELQQVVFSKESDGGKVVLNGTKQPSTQQPRIVKKPTATSNGRQLLHLTPVPRPSHKVLVQSINSLKPVPTTTVCSRQKLQKPPLMVGRREKESSTTFFLNKPFRCNHCSRLFVNQSKYYDHDCVKQQPSSSQMLKAAPFQCTHCNDGFRRELYWQKHMYEAHGICSENFGITCTICQIQFSQKQDYQLHVLAMH